MMTSQVARTLQAKGLISREADLADSRIRRLAVTAAGRELAPRAIAAVETADRAYFVCVEDQPGLRPILRTLAVPPH
jgi:DNA-binding MarR family transcriptional regulator